MKILVTGASSGIGKELIKQLISEGHIVWGLARDGELLDNLHKELHHNNSFFFTACDICDEGELRLAFQEMQEIFSPEVVILAAGIFPNDINPEFDYESFSKAIETNLFGCLNIV